MNFDELRLRLVVRAGGDEAQVVQCESVTNLTRDLTRASPSYEVDAAVRALLARRPVWYFTELR